MKTPHLSFMRGAKIAIAISAVVLQAFPLQFANAAQITTRSLTLQAGAAAGGSKPGGVVNHLFNFTIPSIGGTNVGSIKFQYCTLAAGTCVTPTGLSTTSATLGTETGFTGMTLVNTVNGEPYVKKASPTAVNPGQIVSYQLQGVTNPSAVNYTFFVRIQTFATTDATGPSTDAGSVTAATAEPIVLSGTMPESLVFCTGATVPLTLTTPAVPDCANATSGVISFNQLFSPTDTATSSSQMAASTNAGAGYAISVNGPTLTSGSNTIVGMGASGPGVRGVSQFGLNLKANTTLTSSTAVGTEVAPAANATNYRGEAATGYSNVDNFKFTSGDTVADSYNGGAGGTDAQIFTVSYMANVPGSQPAGTYTTTLTYICTPTF